MNTFTIWEEFFYIRDPWRFALFCLIFLACDFLAEQENETVGLVDPQRRVRPSYVKVPLTFSQPYPFRFTHAECENGSLDLNETDKELEYYFWIPEYKSCTLTISSKEILSFSWKDKIYCVPIEYRNVQCEVKPQKK